MELQFKENGLTPSLYNELRTIAGWGAYPENQVQIALKNSLCTLTAFHNEKAVGIGRIVGDGAINFYIQDIIVRPEYQGQGVGKAIVEKLMTYAQANGIPGTSLALGLFAAKDKEEFYTKLGFSLRPNENRGAGMDISLVAGKDKA